MVATFIILKIWQVVMLMQRVSCTVTCANDINLLDWLGARARLDEDTRKAAKKPYLTLSPNKVVAFTVKLSLLISKTSNDERTPS